MATHPHAKRKQFRRVDLELARLVSHVEFASRDATDLFPASNVQMTIRCASTRRCHQESMQPLADSWSAIDYRREEIGLKVVTEIAKETLRVVCAIAVNLEGPSKSPGGLPVAGSLHYPSLEVSQQTHMECFSPRKLRQLSEAYIEDVHILHPIFDAPEEMCHVFIEEYGYNVATTGSIMPSLKNAIVLLLLALGSCKPISDGTKHSGVLPGMVYHSYAQAILASKREKHDISVAQAMTLAALYENQIGMLQESCASVSYAYRIYTDLRNQ